MSKSLLQIALDITLKKKGERRKRWFVKDLKELVIRYSVLDFYFHLL